MKGTGVWLGAQVRCTASMEQSGGGEQRGRGVVVEGGEDGGLVDPDEG